MKKLLASASILVLGSIGASAADLPMKAAPMIAPIPVFSWTGCYIGGHVGGGTQHDSFTQDNILFGGIGVGIGGSGNNNGTGTGAVAGGQIGCNYQDGNAVFGLEGEGYWSGIRTSTGFSVQGEGLGITLAAKNKDDFSIAARVGIAFDRTLLYGKAGWVWGDMAFGATETIGLLETISVDGSKTLDGLLLGVGIEHAFTRNWTVKLEYNFLDFGSKGVTFTECFSGGGCSPFTINTTEHVNKHIFKVGFNYLFPVGGYAPVVAKY
jgi:outer membrane immunogenic protein